MELINCFLNLQNLSVHRDELRVRDAFTGRLRGVRDQRREHAPAAGPVLRELLHVSLWGQYSVPAIRLLLPAARY